jgi:hypothetical protein
LVFENMPELHEAIIKLSRDRDLRTLMGKNGYDAVMNEQNMEIVKENLIQLYNSIGDKV